VTADWRPIDTLDEAGSGDVLFWNPCDGCHLLWMLFEGGAHAVRQNYKDCFTHWMSAPEGPCAPQ
jgi:hypothetical protein